MKNFTLSVIFTCALCAATAVAQMAPGGSQGTQQSSPGMSGPRGQQQPGMGQPDQNSPMGQTDQTGNTSNRTEKSEKKLKGCVQSQGGQYVLETKKGKAVALSGQDVSAHVGHEVAVKGSWEKGGSSGMSQSSAGTASSNEKAFNVTSVDMISDTCGGKGKGKSSDMGTSGMGNGSTGSGNNPAGTGTGTTGATGTGTQPPQ
jgi:hypothetical protein